MKNIHILPTDNPSRLHLWTDENGTRLETCELEYSHARNKQNIYITNNEEIKEGDWFIDLRDIDTVDGLYDEDVYCAGYGGSSEFANKIGKKIILTTDQDLIYNGIQSIDYEFLKWFVENPNCEFVEVVKDSYTMQQIFELKLRPDIFKYKIIIPKEKLSTKLHIGEVVDESYPKAFRKQETLEETFNFQEKLKIFPLINVILLNLKILLHQLKKEKILFYLNIIKEN